MRMLLIILTLFFADLNVSATDYPPTYYIPAAGSSTSLDYFDIASQTFYITTSGSVNLGSNTYTLTYASLPPANTTWNVVFDATNLTVTTNTNVNLFGETPLSTYYPIKKFFINYSVVWDAGVPSKKVTYFGSLADLKTFTQATTFSATTTFNGRVNFNDTIKAYGGLWVPPASAILAGRTLIAEDTTGKITYGCAPWCVLGNSGLNSTINFLGNIDSVALRFRVNNSPSGIIDYNLTNTAYGYETLLRNTTGNNNVSIGALSLTTNTTGVANTAVGVNSLALNTTGFGCVAIGADALLTHTSGSYNVAIGNNAFQSLTTGVQNVAVGNNACLTLVNGGYNTILGEGTDVATTSTSHGISLGNGAVASSNQLAIAGIRAISIPGMTSSVRRVLMDTSGTADFIPQPLPQNQGTTFTPLTGDSVTATTCSNTINPAGTIANFTIRLPASPYSWQILTFTSTQVVTTLHWSTALNQSNSVESHVATAFTAGGALRIQYNPTLSEWLNY